MNKKNKKKPAGRVIDIDNMSEAETLEVEQLLRAERLKTKPSEKWGDIKDSAIFHPRGTPAKPANTQSSVNQPKASGVSDKDKAALAEARKHTPTAGYDAKLPAAQAEVDQIELSYRAKQKARNEMLRRNMGKFGDCIFIPSEHR